MVLNQTLVEEFHMWEELSGNNVGNINPENSDVIKNIMSHIEHLKQ